MGSNKELYWLKYDKPGRMTGIVIIKSFSTLEKLNTFLVEFQINPITAEMWRGVKIKMKCEVVDE